MIMVVEDFGRWWKEFNVAIARNVDVEGQRR
jgi:hypothetical protein